MYLSACCIAALSRAKPKNQVCMSDQVLKFIDEVVNKYVDPEDEHWDYPLYLEEKDGGVFVCVVVISV